MGPKRPQAPSPCWDVDDKNLGTPRTDSDTSDSEGMDHNHDNRSRDTTPDEDILDDEYSDAETDWYISESKHGWCYMFIYLGQAVSYDVRLVMQ